MPHQPTAVEFYDFYEDVVEIKNAAPEVYLITSGLYSLWSDEKKIANFEVNDRIIGRATGWIERNNSSASGVEVDLEFAIWIAIERPRTERIALDGKSWTINTMWVNAEQVSVSYQMSAERMRLEEIRRFRRNDQFVEGA